VKYNRYTKTVNINAKKLTNIKLGIKDNYYACKTAYIMNSGQKILPGGFNMFKRVHSRAFVKQVRSSVHASVSCVWKECNSKSPLD
jgi:hypothetical protein